MDPLRDIDKKSSTQTMVEEMDKKGILNQKDIE
jgi:hypothetical protein